MSRKHQGKKSGKRFTKPKSQVTEARRGDKHAESFVADMLNQSAAQCLRFDGQEYRTPPAALGKLEYHCDMPQLSGFAGIPAFMKLAYSLGLANRVADLPLSKRRSRYSPAKLCEVMVATLAAGLERVSHIDDVSHDPGLCAAVGVQRLPDQATFSRFFRDVSHHAVGFLRHANRQFSRQTTTFKDGLKRLVVDGDTRIVGVYGKQEGSKICPRNNGRAQYTFEIATLRNSHEILDGGLLEGATHPAPLFVERFEALLEQLSGKCEELVFCGDAAWHSAAILQQIEAADSSSDVACACRYAIRAQGNRRLRQAIAGIAQDAWKDCAEDTQIAEVQFGFVETRSGADERLRRHVVTRELLAEKCEEAGQGVLVPQPRYEYFAIVTNLDWQPERVWHFYNGRATVEIILKEGALGFQMDHLPSSRLAGNGVFCQLLILAYNLVNVFRRLCLPKQHCRHHVQTLRRMVLAVPGHIERTSEGLSIRCAAQGPQAGLLPSIMSALEYWLRPVARLWAVPGST
jgi:hypothetical protein